MNELISTAKALSIVLANKNTLKNCLIPIAKALGRTLAQEIIADRDFPPYHRVTMDGIALSTKALEKGIIAFVCKGVQLAGDEPMSIADETKCIEIMTGAVLPEGCDCVIRYEDLEKKEGSDGMVFKIISGVHKKMQNIHTKGLDAIAGDVLLKKGRKINENDIAIAASCGYTQLKVKRKPSFLIVNTGNELVGAAEIPLPHQIRMSNGILLEALIKKWGGRSRRIKVDDDKDSIKTLLQTWQNKVEAILFTGGVSMGKSDYVPEVLSAEEFEILFHGVAQRPGKPFLFARKENCLVFGFPGNPVSVSVCAHYYLKAWMQKFETGKDSTLKKMKLGQAFSFDKKLDYFLPVRFEGEENNIVIPEIINGSGDFISLRNADGYVILPAEESHFEEGRELEFVEF
jgi:molybdopterin molybdotransferase